MKQAHINLDETLGVKYAILPGDPARVDKVMPYLTDAEVIAFNREYKSAVGYYKGIKVLVMSTGMGGVSTAIGVEELRKIGVETMIRIGSCGALVDGIKVGDVIISCGCVRDDGTSHSYIRASYPAAPDFDLTLAMKEAAIEGGYPYHIGITRSHESFYAELEAAQEEYWKQQNVLCDDMETAPLFVVGRLRGAKCASILNCVVTFDGNKEESIADYVATSGGLTPSQMGERNEILITLEAIAKMEGK